MTKLPRPYLIILVFIVAFLLGFIAFYLVQSANREPGQIACTADAKLCSDGSAVGRTGPRCEFAPCPGDPGTGTLTGKVIIGPICPVEIAGEPCEIPAEAYTSRGIIIFNSLDEELMRVYFREDGTYRTTLLSGDYRVELIPSGIDSAAELPATVNIVNGEVEELNLNIDTGVR